MRAFANGEDKSSNDSSTKGCSQDAPDGQYIRFLADNRIFGLCYENERREPALISKQTQRPIMVSVLDVLFRASADKRATG